jgi:hypothetical protein
MAVLAEKTYSVRNRIDTSKMLPQYAWKYISNCTSAITRTSSDKAIIPKIPFEFQ